ncbi:MAG TPA: carbohydrate ABC transporter permease [Candidatus Limiplasma stercoravium]|nr:carbohydrate ABC transporter permease [Candidatus Limiplasma stercoravium]
MIRTHHRIHRQASDAVFDTVLYAICGLLLLVILYPLWFIIIASFSDPSAVAGGHVWLWPVSFTLDGYDELLRQAEVWIGYRNTIAYTLLGTLFGLVVNISAAFVLSRRDLWGRRLLMSLYVFTMFFSGGLIPIFLTVQEMGFYNNFWVMIIPFSVSAYNIIVARTFFETSLPPDLWDAAQIDGCGNLRFFFTMALPLSKAVISVIALWTAVGQWNSYFNALIYIRDDSLYPLQLIMRNILITNQNFAALGTGEAAMIAMRRANLVRYSMIIIATVPIMCVYPFIQKHFDQGVMIGAVKG